VDIISSFGYLKPIILTMQLCEMLIQAMWINDSPLMQIMDKALAKNLEETYSLKSINDFINMEEEDRENAFKDKNKKEVEKIAEACNRYPIMSMSH
jgi:pre-mRNA-splicing helicase BRR2